MLQDLQQLGIPLVAFRPEGDKVMRMSAQSAKIEGGLVYIPERAPWLNDFKTEVLQFPLGRYDDQVDSLSQALGWFDHHNADHRIVGDDRVSGHDGFAGLRERASDGDGIASERCADGRVRGGFRILRQAQYASTRNFQGLPS